MDNLIQSINFHNWYLCDFVCY